MGYMSIFVKTDQPTHLRAVLKLLRKFYLNRLNLQGKYSTEKLDMAKNIQENIFMSSDYKQFLKQSTQRPIQKILTNIFIKIKTYMKSRGTEKANSEMINKY